MQRLFWLVLLLGSLLLVSGQIQDLGIFQLIQTATESEIFVSDDGAPDICGLFILNGGTTITQVLNLGQDLSLTGAYNVTGIVNATTLTVAMVLRDYTVMPETSFAAFSTTVANGNAIIQMITNITTTGSAMFTAYSNFTFAVGSMDGYGNVFSAGDMYGFDAAVYFTSPVENQNVTLGYVLSAPLYVQW